MSEDILERAKAILNINDDSQAWGDGVLSVIDELIAEVEAKNDKIAQDAITIQMHHNNVLTLQKEVERLRAENRELKKTDVWANDVIKEHESLNARIKELEALNELNHKNMRSWLDTTTDKEFLDKLSSEIGFKDAYIKRLEAAFLEATKEIVYAIHEGRDAPEGEDAYAEKVAREAQERIKAGGKDEA